MQPVVIVISKTLPPGMMEIIGYDPHFSGALDHSRIFKHQAHIFHSNRHRRHGQDDAIAICQASAVAEGIAGDRANANVVEGKAKLFLLGAHLFREPHIAEAALFVNRRPGWYRTGCAAPCLYLIERFFKLRRIPMSKPSSTMRTSAPMMRLKTILPTRS